MTTERRTRGRPGRIDRLGERFPEIKARLDELLDSGATQAEILRRLEGPLREAGESPLSAAGLNRYASRTARRIAQIDAATQAAKAMMAHDPDAEGNLAAASIKLAQSRMFDFLMAAEEGDPREMTAAARALADLGRATVTINRERERVLAKAAEAGARSAERVAREHGYALPPEALVTIRRDIYGIHDVG